MNAHIILLSSRAHLCALLEPFLLLGDQHDAGERLGHLGTQRVLLAAVIGVRVRVSRHVPLPITVHKLSVVSAPLLPLPDAARLFHDPAAAAAAAATRLVQRLS